MEVWGADAETGRKEVVSLMHVDGIMKNYPRPSWLGPFSCLRLQWLLFARRVIKT